MTVHWDEWGVGAFYKDCVHKRANPNKQNTNEQNEGEQNEDSQNEDGQNEDEQNANEQNPAAPKAIQDGMLNWHQSDDGQPLSDRGDLCMVERSKKFEGTMFTILLIDIKPKN